MEEFIKIATSVPGHSLLEEGILVLDPAGAVREYNDAAFSLLDNHPDILLKGPFKNSDGSILEPEDLPWAVSLQTKEPASGEICFCALTDNILLKTDTLPLKNLLNQVTGILVRLSPALPPDDLSLHTRLNFRTLFENLTSEIHVWKVLRDEAGEIKTWKAVYANPTALNSWGIPSLKEITGKTTEEIFGPGSTAQYLPVIQKIFREGVPYYSEDYFPNLDKYFHFTSIPLGDYFITTGSDISSIKRQQKHLDRQFRELKAVFDSTHDSIIVYNMDGDVVFINDTFLKKSYVKDQEKTFNTTILAGLFDIYKLNGELLPPSNWPVQRVLKGERITEECYKVVPKGAPHGLDLVFNGSPIYDNDGKQILAVTITRDITGQKETELALRESEARFRMLADNISPMVWIIDAHGENFWVNKRFIDYTGLTSEDLRRTGGTSVHHPDYLHKAQEKFLHAISNGIPYEDTFPIKGMDGNYRWFLTHAVPIRDEEGNIKQWFGTNTDITDQRELLNKYKWTERLAHLGSFVHYLDTGIVDASEEFWKIFEIVPEKHKAPWHALIVKVHPDDLKRISESPDVNKIAKPFETELRLVMHNGSEKYVYLYDVAEADASGNIIKRYGAVMDITERKTAELKLLETLLKLEESETKLLNAQRMAKMGNVEFDLVNNKIFWSPEVYRIFGLPQSTWTPLFDEVMKYIHPDDKERVLKEVQALPDGETVNLEYRLLLSDGKIKYINYIVTPVFESGRQVKRIGTIQDITERKLLELNLQQTLKNLHEKISDKEMLLRELYHRTKNNMQVISSLLNLKASAISNESDRGVFLEMRNRIHAMSLVHDMLYRNKNISRLNLGIYIKDVSEMLLRSHIDHHPKITASFDLADIEVPLDLAMPCGFVVTELVLNVIKHAFPDKRKGELSITLRADKDRLIQIRISDDGVGISQSESADNLGLELTRSIVEEQLNGHITLDKTKGTAWTVTFPDNQEERILPVNF